MPRSRSPERDRARQLWEESGKQRKLKDIAEELGVSPEQVRKWKNQDHWNGNVTKQVKSNVIKRRGGQPGNHNGKGAPLRHKRSEKYGFFSRYLPDETREIVEATAQANPLDLLWHQIQLSYAAILRAQKIAYVRDREDSAPIGETGMILAENRQVNFLVGQARAQESLARLIKQYDALLHANWELATEEQKARIEALKAKAALTTEEPEDDGFLDALNAKAGEVWDVQD